jgi:hypothetical protein
MIADEIQSGLGRVGTTFACEAESVVPDAYLLGKALGGGIVPVSAMVSSRSVLGVLKPGQHGSTFGGNPLACAVAREVIAMLATGEYQARSATLGAVLHKRLGSLPASAVSSVSGRGLWAGVTFASLDGRVVCERLAALGVLAKETHGTTIRLAPPLVITSGELDWGLERFGEAIAAELPLTGLGRAGPGTEPEVERHGGAGRRRQRAAVQVPLPGRRCLDDHAAVLPGHRQDERGDQPAEGGEDAGTVGAQSPARQ